LVNNIEMLITPRVAIRNEFTFPGRVANAGHYSNQITNLAEH